MEDSLAEFYYEQLKSTTNPVGTLVAFYKSLFNVDKADESTYKTFARLYRIYGKQLLYFALLDCSDMENIDLSIGMSGLLSYFAKKRLESTRSFDVAVNLSDLVKEFEKDGEKRKKIKININPFEEEPANE
jgi:hypothetical protein